MYRVSAIVFGANTVGSHPVLAIRPKHDRINQPRRDKLRKSPNFIPNLVNRLERRVSKRTHILPLLSRNLDFSINRSACIRIRLMDQAPVISRRIWNEYPRVALREVDGSSNSGGVGSWNRGSNADW